VNFFLPTAIVVILDQVAKQAFWRNGQDYAIVPGWLHITLLKNAGAAFGLFQGARGFFVVASALASILIIYIGLRLPREEVVRRVTLGMILGGAIGNLIDRLMFGEVIDFVQIGWNGHFWPVFNVADMGVSVGAAVLLIYLLFFSSRAGAPALEVDASDPTQSSGASQE